ncbi:MAG TPA: response regulator, partial [Burkholderiaceae bacterium]
SSLLRTAAGYLGASVGAIYRVEQGALIASGVYGIDLGSAEEGARQHTLASEVAASGKPALLRKLPPDYLRAGSGLGSASPRTVLIVPVTADGALFGVLELGFLHDGDFKQEQALLARIAESAGVALRTALYRQNLRELLEQTQRQSEELQTQQEELRVTNEELEEQARVLRESQAALELQQTELEQSNVQLEEQTQLLERQKEQLLQAQRTLEVNADELTRASRYKSEFLANMSHELRTPLNSSLILSHLLAQNATGTLSEEQVRYAKTIHSSNTDLLTLINDILDLSKIEAGHADLQAEAVTVAGIIAPLRDMFEPVAREKGIRLSIEVAQDAPASFVSDSGRLRQVLKNLLSNAFKFTENGEVTMQVTAAGRDRIAFAVHDTGIGIPESQQKVIFEAFRQADGTTSRRYGGTGLGLSISRELAHLLGGEIRLQSAPGLGSTFTVEVALDLQRVLDAGPDKPLPPPVAPASEQVRASAPAANLQPAPVSAGGLDNPLADDRAARGRERLILAIEDDLRFAAILRDLAHELDFDFLHAATAFDAMALAREHRPSAILLDVGLPDQSGLSVLERLKRDPATRHIPVHMMSVDDHVQTALELGAIGYVLKPVARDALVEAIGKLEQRLQARARRVLVVEDDPTLRENIALLLQADDISITTAGTVEDALAQVAATTFDCMVMDLHLPDGSGYDLLERMAAADGGGFPPVIVYTGKALSRDEEQRLRQYSRSIIIKGARSPERLLDEVTLFLHRVESTLPQSQQALLQQARQRDAVFEGRRILVAEDDVRNIFALSSILEPLGAKLLIARNGQEALDLLRQHSDIDIVLMDLMMPVMDGLTAIREIRKTTPAERLPILALTAKAMADDRRSCLDAGANDYIAKPLDVDKLISLCRVWMPK